MLLKLFSRNIFSALKVPQNNYKFLRFSGKKLPEMILPGRKSRETSQELDLGQDRPTQRVSAKSVQHNAPRDFVYSIVHTLGSSIFI